MTSRILWYRSFARFRIDFLPRSVLVAAVESAHPVMIRKTAAPPNPDFRHFPFMPRRTLHTTFATIAIALGALAPDRLHAAEPQPAKEALPEQVSFNAHIRPIFSNTCFACHGFDKSHRKADLRLDVPEGAYAKLKDSNEFAIVPGKPAESAIWKRIIAKDPETVMPP